MIVEEAALFGAGEAGRCGSLLQEVWDPATGSGMYVTPPKGIPDGLTGQGVVTAVIDTGLAAEHPAISAQLQEQVDLSGDGLGDRCGHGTVVALILLATAPDTRLIDVKAFDDQGRASPDRLVEALDWVGKRAGINVVQMSAGVYRPWCNKDCNLCKAALRLSVQNIFVVAAAGNRPGETACPAKAVGGVSEIIPGSLELSTTSGDAGLAGVAANGVAPERIKRRLYF